MRKLVTIQKILDIIPIANADMIEVARVNGWTGIVKKGQFKVGDECVFFEIDSFLPEKPQFEFLRKGCFKDLPNLGRGFRIRSMKLRGVLSQGLIMPLDEVGVYHEGLGVYKFSHDSGRVEIFGGDVDLSEMLGVQKYEPPVPTNLMGKAKGAFPSFLHKTDQERCLCAGTMVKTIDGDMDIKDIVEKRIHTKVLSINHDLNLEEYRQTTSWSIMKKLSSNWLKINTKSGKVLICTKNHRIWCDDIKSYRLAQDLQIGQKLLVKTD